MKEVEVGKEQEFTEESLRKLINEGIAKRLPGGPSQYSSRVDRINRNLYIVYERTGDQPFVIESRGAILVKNGDNPVKRSYEIKKGCNQKLELAWLEGKAGDVIIKNTTGIFLHVNPTDEEKKKIERAYIDVRNGNGSSLIPPKDWMKFRPALHSKVSIYSPDEDASVTVWILPE